MNRYISPDLIEKIRIASDIVEIIAQYVPLKKTGSSYKGLCPFHHEKTPSFVISPEKQIFHCFGCGVGGNVINFIMKIDNVSFVEAAQYLGEKYNIHLDDKNCALRTNSELSVLKESIFSANKDALEFFHHTLLDPALGRAGLDYLTKRGIDRETIKTFSLGYAPLSWDGLIKFFTAKGKTNHSLLLKAGLIRKREGKPGYYDVFRNRVIFPIFDIQNRVIGFGGRSIEHTEQKIPKYINTPETPVYIKGKNLFGLHLTKESIRLSKSAIIVEGYLDLITVYQHGIKNIVATSGTALTDEQVRLIKRYSEEAVIVFDGDSAGDSAAERGFHNLFTKGGVNVKVIALPEGSDPDSYVKVYGKDRFFEEVENSKPFIEHMIEKVAEKIKRGGGIDKQIEQVNKLIGVLADIPNAIERTSYLSSIAEKTGISDNALLSELEKAVLRGKREIAIPGSFLIKKKKNAAEYVLIQVMLLNKEKIEEVKALIEPDDFEDSDLSRLAEMLFDLSDRQFSVADIANFLPQDNDRMVNLVSKATMERVEFCDMDKTIRDCIKKIRKRKLRLQMGSLIERRKKIANDGLINKEEYNKLQNEYNSIRKEMG